MQTNEAPTPATEVSISRSLSAFSADEQMQLLANLKLLAISNPQQARQLLYMNPQLSYAVLEMLIRLELIDSNVVKVCRVCIKRIV